MDATVTIETSVNRSFEMTTKINFKTIDEALGYIKQNELYTKIDIECIDENLYSGFGYDSLDNYTDITIKSN